MWAKFGTGPTTSRRWGWFERRNTLWPPRQCRCTKSRPGPEIKIILYLIKASFCRSMCLPIWVCEHQRISVSRPSSVPAVYRREPERPSHLPGNLHYPCTPSSWRSPCRRTMRSMLGQMPNLEDKTKASSNSENCKWPNHQLVNANRDCVLHLGGISEKRILELLYHCGNFKFTLYHVGMLFLVIMLPKPPPINGNKVAPISWKFTMLYSCIYDFSMTSQMTL